MSEPMDHIDQQQQREIQALQAQDEIHKLLLKLIGVGFFTLILIIVIMAQLLFNQKVYIENLDCVEVKSTK